MARKVVISEEALRALAEGRVKVRWDVKLRYGKYRILGRYVAAGAGSGGEGSAGQRGGGA
ncbi:hypothetical protein [Thermofilum pendens]